MEPLQIKLVIDNTDLEQLPVDADQAAKATVASFEKGAKDVASSFRKMGQAHRAEAEDIARTAAATGSRQSDAAQQAAASSTRSYAATAAAFKQAAADQVIQIGKVRDAQGRFIAQGAQGAAAGRAGGNSQKASWMSVGGALELASKAAQSYAGQMAGMSTVSTIISGIGQAIEGQYRRANQLADEFIAKRDSFRELAGILGKDANSSFTIDQAKFAVETAQTVDEARTFRGAFQGSGAQHIGEGRSLNAEQGAIYEKKAASYLTSQGLDPTVAGDLSGTFLGSQNFGKKGGAKAAMDSLARSNTILQAGRGDANVNARNLAQLSAASVNEDSLKGQFTNNEEAATAISVMAEYNPAESAQMVQASTRAVRDFTGDAAPLLKKAGVNPKTPYFDAMRKLAATVKAEATDKGINSKDYLKEFIPDERARTAVDVMINRGVNGGVIDSRTAAGQKTVNDEGQSLLPDDVINRFQTDIEGAGPQRIAAASKKQAELEQGATTAASVTLRTAGGALGEKAKDNRSWTQALGMKFQDATSYLGTSTGDQAVDNSVIAKYLEGKRADAGLGFDKDLANYRIGSPFQTPAGADATFAGTIKQLSGATGKSELETWKEVLKELKEINTKTKPATAPLRGPVTDPRPKNRGGPMRPGQR